MVRKWCEDVLQQVDSKIPEISDSIKTNVNEISKETNKSGSSSKHKAWRIQKKKPIHRKKRERQ